MPENSSVEKRVKGLTAAGVAVAVVVAGISGRTSYGHIFDVATRVGEQEAGLIPFSVDGMMIAGAAMSAVDRLRGYEPRRWATVALWFGTFLTFAFNVASAWERGIGAAAVAAVPALALVVTVEAVFKPSRRILRMVTEAIASPVPAGTVPEQAQRPETAVEPSVLITEPVTLAPVVSAAGGPLDGFTGTPPTFTTKRRARPRKAAVRVPEDTVEVASGEPVEVG